MDILLLVEIAGSSLDYDREVKSRIYAESGMCEYWLADLDALSVSYYSEPAGGAYRTLRQYRFGQSMAPLARRQCPIPVDALRAD